MKGSTSSEGATELSLSSFAGLVNFANTGGGFSCRVQILKTILF